MNPDEINKAIAEHLGKIDRDYYNDLNAMREARKVLDNLQRWAYLDHLAEIMQDQEVKTTKDRTYDLVDASAAQHAKAFLRTIKV